jgi:DNA primase
VLLTESAIDALSLAILDKQRSQSPGATVYLSTDGAGAIPLDALKHVMARGGQVFVAFDGDPPGEAMAWRVAQQLPGVKRLTPAYGKDWNERLVQDGHPEQATRPERDKQLLQSLWQWHQAAREVGKSENYLSRITEVAREVVRGGPLSDKARVAMQQDLQMAQQQHPSRPSRLK